MYSAGADALLCYTGGPIQGTIVKMKVPTAEGVTHVCARYRYQCYKGSSCTDAEVARKAFAWQYIYTSEKVCNLLGEGGTAKDLVCCKKDLCNNIITARDKKTKVLSPNKIFP